MFTTVPDLLIDGLARAASCRKLMLTAERAFTEPARCTLLPGWPTAARVGGIQPEPAPTCGLLWRADCRDEPVNTRN